MDTQDKQPIEFFTTEELLTELSQRSSSLALAMMPRGAKSTTEIRMRLAGNRLECVGLTLELSMVAKLASRNYWKSQPFKEDPNA